MYCGYEFVTFLQMVNTIHADFAFPYRFSLLMGHFMGGMSVMSLTMANGGRRWLHFLAVILHCVISSGYKWRGDVDGRHVQGTDSSELIKFNIAHYNDIHSHLYPADISMSECNPDTGFGEHDNTSFFLDVFRFLLQSS